MLLVDIVQMEGSELVISLIGGLCVVAAAAIPAWLNLRSRSQEQYITLKAELDSIKSTTGQKNGKGSLISMMETLLDSQTGQDIRMARSDRRQAQYEEKVISIERHLSQMHDRVANISDQVSTVTGQIDSFTVDMPPAVAEVVIDAD